MKPWKSKDLIEDNAVGLSKEAVEALIPDLDRHASSLFVLYRQYHKHHWLVEGPQFVELHAMFLASYQQLFQHIDDLAERLTALGGVPTCAPDAMAKLSYVTHEPEGVFRVRDMISHDMAIEAQIAVELRKTIATSIRVGDPTTETLLKEILLQLEDRAHHLQHLVGDDTLEFGIKIPDYSRQGH